MVKLLLPPVPRGPMFVGDTMTVEWQEFFRNLYERVGGYGGDIDSLLYLSASNKDSNYDARLDDLESLVLNIIQSEERGYGVRLDDLESLVFQLAQTGDKGFGAQLDALEVLATTDDIVCHGNQVVCHDNSVVTS